MRRIAFTAQLGLLFVLPASLRAAVIQAQSVARSDVRTAINAAQDGDTVMVPAGTGVWSNGVSIIGKRITLQGAGMEQTVIHDRTEYAITIKGGKPFRITGIGFDGTGSVNGRSITLREGEWSSFRVDHCRFFNERHSFDFMQVRAAGVIDHCRFDSLELKGGGDHVVIYASGNYSAAWKRPPGMGTADAIYIEDCTFNFFTSGNSDRPYVGMGKGARVVFRHNVANHGCFEAFGAYNHTTGRRGTVSFECYDNVFGGDCYCLFTIKGGTATIFNNTITGYGKGCFNLTNYRSIPYGTQVQYKPCDGMRAIDGNMAFETGTHTGGNNASTLRCSGKQWTPGQWVGWALWNTTDDSVGRITTNTADTITAAGGLKEGYTVVSAGTVTAVKGTKMTCAGKSWGWGHFEEFCWVYNVTDGSYGRVLDNGPDTITARLEGGTLNAWTVGDQFQVTQVRPHGGIEKDWDTGDAFKIANGYPGLDQIGRAQDADAENLQPQLHSPLYEWNNTVNGQNLNPWVKGGGTPPHSERDHIKKNRDFFCDTPRPGYTPYTYPHPLTLGGGDTPAPPAFRSVAPAP